MANDKSGAYVPGKGFVTGDNKVYPTNNASFVPKGYISNDKPGAKSVDISRTGTITIGQNKYYGNTPVPGTGMTANQLSNTTRQQAVASGSLSKSNIGRASFSGMIAPQTQSQVAQDQSQSLARQNVLTAATAQQRDTNYAISNRPDILSNAPPQAIGTRIGGGYIFDSSVQDYKPSFNVNTQIQKVLNVVAVPVSKAILSSPIFSYSRSSLLPTSVQPIASTKAGQFLQQKTGTPSYVALAFGMASTPFMETGASTAIKLANAGFNLNTANAFVSPIEKYSFGNKLSELSSSQYNAYGKLISTQDSTSTYSLVIARRTNSAESFSKSIFEITPTGETSAEAFSRGTTGINIKGLSGTTFTSNQPFSSMAKITDISPIAFSYEQGKNKVNLGNVFRGNIEGITNLKIAQGGDTFKFIGVSQQKNGVDNIMSFGINPKIGTAANIKSTSETFIPVAGRSYSPMKITRTSESGFSIDYSNLRFSGGGRITYPVEDTFSSTILMKGTSETSLSSSSGLSTTQFTKGMTNLGLTSAGESQARQLSNINIISKAPSVFTSPQALQSAFSTGLLGQTKRSSNSFATFESIVPLQQSKTNPLAMSIPQQGAFEKFKLGFGTSSTLDFRTNQISPSASGTNSIQIPGLGTGLITDVGFVTPQKYNDIFPISPINPRLFGGAEGGGGVFDLPSLGGYSIPNPRTRGRKANLFNISPGFTSIVLGTKMKSPLKVSRTFGVTPFQTRGLLVGKASKGSYYKLTDI